MAVATRGRQLVLTRNSLQCSEMTTLQTAARQRTARHPPLPTRYPDRSQTCLRYRPSRPHGPWRSGGRTRTPRHSQASARDHNWPRCGGGEPVSRSWSTSASPSRRRPHSDPRGDARPHRPARALHRLPAPPGRANGRAMRGPAPSARGPRQSPFAGTAPFEGLSPIRILVVLLLDHAPGEEELRRIQAQENPREPLSLRDQQEQFRDCWQARAGLPEADRIAVVCADLGISTGKGHSLRRQLALPDPIRERVAERPAGDQLSVRMAHRLADMHDIAPELAAAVARRVTTGDLHDQALRDLGGFVHRTVVENDDVYAVRIDDGVVLDAAEQVQHARRHLTAGQQPQAAAVLGCAPDKLDPEFDALAARARSHALKLHVDGTLRDRARNGRYAWTFDRGQDFAAGIWVIDPVFMIDTVRQQLADADTTPVREDGYFAGARLDDEDLRDAAEDDRQRRGADRARHAEPTASNVGLGHDTRAALADPTDEQMRALRDIVCRLLCAHHADVIAYGAGW